jgi:hypothetical protein
MSNQVQLPKAAVWQNMSQQAGHTANKSAIGQDNPHADHLPPVPPSGKAWAEFTASSAKSKPYTAHLSKSVQGISRFIEHHAAKGPQKNKALAMLRDFEATKVNCRTSNLTPMMVNENRRNLHLIASQLDNESIPIEKRIGAALALTEGLNVCAEGTTLNILNCASELAEQPQGLAGLVMKTKNELIEQNLLQLVKQQDGRHLSTKLAKDLEIHHVQALKNHVADSWGLPVVEDRYATKAYQDQAGAMAVSLIDKTITPVALANVVADKIGNHLCSLTGYNLNTGMPADQLKTSSLGQMLQAEFGSAIELSECLEFNEDYTEVKLKPQAELSNHVLQAFKQIGLVPQDASIKFLASQPHCSVEQALEQVQHLQGAVTEFRSNTGVALNTSFWFGATLHNDAQKAKEEERDAERQRHRNFHETPAYLNRH